MNRSFEVSAFYPAGPGLVLHVLTVEVSESLAWVKAHADDIVAKAIRNGLALCALWVKEI